jgi:hypothetical protein
LNDSGAAFRCGLLSLHKISCLYDKYAAVGWFSLGDLHIATKTTAITPLGVRNRLLCHDKQDGTRLNRLSNNPVGQQYPKSITQ